MMVANDWKGRKMGSYSSMVKKFQLNKVNKVKKSAVQLVCIVTNTKVDHAKCFYNNKIKSKQIAVHPYTRLKLETLSVHSTTWISHNGLLLTERNQIKSLQAKSFSLNDILEKTKKATGMED